MIPRGSDGIRLSDRLVPSVDRALSLLELLASAPSGLNLSAISRRLGIPKSSAYYLVTTLVKRDIVRRSPDQLVYSLGTQASRSVEISRAECDIRTFCAPYIRSLSKTVGMTAQVGIREGAEARIIDRSEAQGVRLDSWVGRHFDLHCTAIGKALISCLADAELEILFRTRGFPKHNEHTVGSLEVLKSHLAEVRRRGFATDDEEHELGVRCVASPIFNYVGGIIGAICIFAPLNRISQMEMPAIGLEVRGIAREVSRELHAPLSSID